MEREREREIVNYNIISKPDPIRTSRTSSPGSRSPSRTATSG